MPAPVLYGSFLYPTEVQCDDSTAFSFHLPSGAVVPADRHARTTILLDTSGITPVPVTFLVPADTRGGRIVLDLSKSQLRDISSSGATTHRWQKAPTFALPLKFPELGCGLDRPGGTTLAKAIKWTSDASRWG